MFGFSLRWCLCLIVCVGVLVCSVYLVVLVVVLLLSLFWVSVVVYCWLCYGSLISWFACDLLFVLFNLLVVETTFDCWLFGGFYYVEVLLLDLTLVWALLFGC